MKEKFSRFKISEVTKEPEEEGFYHLVTNRYWATAEGLIFKYRGASLQCNVNKAIVEKLVAGESHPGKEVIFLEKVWFPHNCNDYI